MKKLFYLLILMTSFTFISCNNDDDSSISTTDKIEISNAQAVYLGSKLGYNNIYEFSSTITNTTTSTIKVIVKYDLRRIDTKEVVAYAESDELTINSKSKRNDKVERQPKGTLYSNVNYELDKATYRIINN